MTERGQSVTEMVVAWGFVAALVAAFAVGYSHWSDDDSLSADEVAYARAVATSQADVYVRALAGEPASLVAPSPSPTPPEAEPTAPPAGPTALAPPMTATIASGPSDGFAVSGTGQRTIEISDVSSAVSLRVSIDSQSSPDGTWVWCFDADFGLAPSDADTQSDAFRLYCANDGTLDPESGLLVADRSIEIKPEWPDGATYFWRILCLTACLWQLEVSR